MRDSRHSRRTYAAFTAIWVIAAACFAPSPAAAVDPAVSQYSLDFPNAVGESHPGATAPIANTAELAPPVRQALGDRDRADGKALAAIATAPELGAPGRAANGSGSGELLSGKTPSVPTAAFRALGDAAVILGLLALLGMILFLAFLARSRPAGKEA